MRNVPENKKCPFCGETKPASAFQRNASRPDGLTYTCRDCIPLYALAPKRSKIDLASVEKICSSCSRTLSSRAFTYDQKSADKLTTNCRICRSYKHGKPSLMQIQDFENAMQEIYELGMSIFDPENNRSQFEAFVYQRMKETNLLINWKPPVWIHSSSKV